jgi:hypothetical protein
MMINKGLPPHFNLNKMVVSALTLRGRDRPVMMGLEVVKVYNNNN